MVKMIEEIRASPTCERCGLGLPGPDPLRRSLTTEEARRFTGDHQPARPVRVAKLRVDGELVTWWCSSRCFYRAFKKPEKRMKGKPSADSQFHINRAA